MPPVLDLAEYQSSIDARGLFDTGTSGGTVWIRRGLSLFDVALVALHETTHAAQVHREGAGRVSKAVYKFRELQARNAANDFGTSSAP